MLDPAITLFGRRIQVKGGVEIEFEESLRSNNDSSVDKTCFDDHIEDEVDKEVGEEESSENDEQDDSMGEAMDESANAQAMSESTDQTEKPIDSEKDENKSNDTKNPDQKQLKKPDKILPCPRCNSMDTKFCYYNNYNVNQPRHFCKSCQRYWTAGGTMRNVPVGAGRRKNKSSSSRYCHITVSEALQAARFDVSNVVQLPGLQTNGTVLTFGPDNPFCEPVTSVVDKTVLNRDDRSSGSTVTTSSVDERSKKGAQEPKKVVDGFGNQMPCFQWPYMWNPAVPVPPPFCPSVFPVPIFHQPYWNGAPLPWNVPWAPQCSPTQIGQGPNPTSPTLGKHTRDGEMVTSTPTTPTTSSSVLMPKTLRIDNPDEAAKSSIWSTLGIKKDNKGDAQSKGFFNSFQSKEADKKDGQVDASPAFIKANPVALCRSLSFQERA
ncbi:hypothetical protein RND81_10G217200 [Saponaria officinalis]|uniref:Dof-type domain-containing protein n=1 Tax=Saponaria officinalis TaxID=3572 RepID=A0AAW1I5T1_SAPOF